MVRLFKAIPEVEMPVYNGNDYPLEMSESATGFSITNHVPGEQVEETLLVASAEIKTSQTGREWLQFTFNSPSGACKGKQWLNQGTAEEAMRPYLETGIVHVFAKVEEYPVDSGNKSLTVQRVKAVHGQSGTTLLPQMPHGESASQYRDQLIGLIDQMEEPLRQLAHRVLVTYWFDFSTRPAALYHHHAYIGGLLKHTACMMTIGAGICRSDRPYLTLLQCIQEAEADHKNDLFQASEREMRQFAWDESFDALYQAARSITLLNESPRQDELLLGILLHDIGKIFEYTHLGASDDRFARLVQVEPTEETVSGITLDPNGVLMGHMPYGCFVLEQALQNDAIRLPIDQYHRLMHMILSHHGKKEWGSSVTPQTTEAWYLHAIDLLDARKEKWRQNQSS
ncbi:HD domain-containing protein [Exiguobacterium antarcticum]|uniref:HD domain-containing protein n=1 Tax=Exiguobacterium antarcticum TaxID=132920 RepID=A0ABT6R4P7_9BACL|nr:HD domain-containing protein [Exiguobacterium antarcticum]MDI3235929.1 HD domain-containing protein [Exiguobacterium antarcticum]